MNKDELKIEEKVEEIQFFDFVEVYCCSECLERHKAIKLPDGEIILLEEPCC